MQLTVSQTALQTTNDINGQLLRSWQLTRNNWQLLNHSLRHPSSMERRLVQTWQRHVITGRNALLRPKMHIDVMRHIAKTLLRYTLGYIIHMHGELPHRHTCGPTFGVCTCAVIITVYMLATTTHPKHVRFTTVTTPRHHVKGPCGNLYSFRVVKRSVTVLCSGVRHMYTHWCCACIHSVHPGCLHCHPSHV